MKATNRKPAGEVVIGTKTARQISGKVTKDMKAMNAAFGNFPARHYSTRVWMNRVTVNVPTEPAYGPGMDEIVPMLEAAGYIVTVTVDGRALNLAHPFWTEAN